MIGNKINVNVKSSTTFQNNVDDKKDKSKDKKKVVVKTVELPIACETHGYSQHELNSFMEQEVFIFVISIYFLLFIIN